MRMNRALDCWRRAASMTSVTFRSFRSQSMVTMSGQSSTIASIAPRVLEAIRTSFPARESVIEMTFASRGSSSRISTCVMATFKSHGARREITLIPFRQSSLAAEASRFRKTAATGFSRQLRICRALQAVRRFLDLLSTPCAAWQSRVWIQLRLRLCQQDNALRSRLAKAHEAAAQRRGVGRIFPGEHIWTAGCCRQS